MVIDDGKREEQEPTTAAEADRIESHAMDMALGGELAGTGPAAIAEFRRLGWSRTVSRGGQLVRIHPDGREEVVEQLTLTPFVRPSNVRLLGRE